MYVDNLKTLPIKQFEDINNEEKLKKIAFVSSAFDYEIRKCLFYFNVSL